ncbi:MAG TPA: sulfatase-like hydrolase/transferase [Acidimicrobiales bacterium]|nr:sulfatase-like hydrolase/transferase [Acidimicrobiales bacterium]
MTDRQISAGTRPNILFVISDQERAWDWLPPAVRLPWRERLAAEGLTLANHYTHSSPCSPSRATMHTGLHVPVHGVLDNTVFPWHASLDTAVPTIGSTLRDAGYRSSYIGKWHASYGPHPPMEAYGYSDWEGNDQHFMGWAGTGVHFDPAIADDAAHWLATNATSLDRPWFLTVALVNPHDVMWYPIDQPGYRSAHPDELAAARALLAAAKWMDGEVVPAFAEDYAEVVDRLPDNFADDLIDKPACQRQWRWDQQHGIWGFIDPADPEAWRRQLDYYARLHELADRSLGTVLGALEASGAGDDTVVVFTSDHGDMCGSHGLRSKGPFVYEEIMKVPAIVKAPGVTAAGGTTTALTSHVDLARTICGLAGVEPAPGMQGVDLGPVLVDPAASVRDQVLFCHATAHTANIRATRWQIRASFDGRYKYARYFGVGGGLPNDDLSGRSTPMLYGPDAAFEDHEHELYDLQEDPHELVNLAHDRGRRADLRRRFDDLRALEAREFVAG